MCDSPVELSLCPACQGLEVIELRKLDVPPFAIVVDGVQLAVSGTRYEWPEYAPCPNRPDPESG